MNDMDNVIVMPDDSEHPETFCEVAVSDRLTIRVSESEGRRVQAAVAEVARNADDRSWIHITGIGGERHTYRASTIIGVSTSTKAARHAAILRDFQDEDEEKAAKQMIGRFDE